MKFLKVIAILIFCIMAMQSSMSQLLTEDFESGSFPPAGWSNPGGWGSIVWSSYYVSGYGSGDYSAFYDGYYWDGDVDSMITDTFSPSFGESLIFDHAYAAYDNSFRQRGSLGPYIYSDLYIYYRLENDDQWYYLETIPGTTLETSPPTSSFFEPTSSEWSTYSVLLPDNTVQLSFIVDNFSSNSLYLDNIRVEYAPSGNDLAVQQVYAKGRYPISFLSSDTISASIKNVGGTTFNNFYVYLELTGANTFLDSVLVPSLNSNQSTVVSFMPYTPVLNGYTSVRVFVQPDDNTPNDEAFYNMNVGSRYLAYNDTTENYSGGIGWFGEGYWLSKYRLTDANTRVKSVNVRIIGAPGSTNQVVRGVILNSAGIVVAKSDPYKIKAIDDNKMVNFKLSDPLPHKIASSNSTFYVGIEQTAIASSDDAYGIQSNQYEDPARSNAFFAANGMKSVGEPLNYLFPWDNRWGIEAEVVPITSTDVGISNQGLVNDQYFSSNIIQPKGRVYNNAMSGTANATVIRTITPGGYTNSQNVSIPANSSVEVTFANWTFTSGTAYTVRDSIVLTGDSDLSDNVKYAPITPRVAKQLAVVYSKFEDRDSLVRAINLDGRFAGNFDTIPMHYTGSLRPFKYVFMNFRRAGNWTDAMRDSIKAYIDGSTAANKKTFVLFHNALTYVDPELGWWSNPADTIFLRQYLKARFVSNDWQINVPADRKFKGKNYFNTVTLDSLYDEWNGDYYPDLIRPVNGSFAAFVPENVTGLGNDSAIAVAYAGPNYNTFVMSNQFHALRAKNGGLTDGPGRIYARIIDWINSTNSNAKVLDLTMLIEGFYDQGANQTVRDTVRVYLRNTTNPYAIVDSAKGFLTTSGAQSFVFNNASNGVNYYIHVKHRNAIETWSKTGAMFASNYLAYNFTSDSAKAYGNNMTKKGTRWVYYGGDVNQDGFIDGTDNNLIDNDAYNFISGYVKTDLNGDDFVDASDFQISDNNANNFIGKSTPMSEPDAMIENGFVQNRQPEVLLNQASQEIRIDHEIYNRFKNEPRKTRSLRTIKKGNQTFVIAE
jgi:hypothetical protein